MSGTVLIISCLACLSLGQAIDINLIAARFGNVVPDVSVDKLEQYVEYGNYFTTFSKINEVLIGDLTTELFRQTRLQTHMLVNAVSSLKSKLDHEIEIKDEYRTENVNSYLTLLNQRFQTFLDFQPGNVEIERKALSDIPDRKKSIHSRVKYHSLKSIFLNMRNILDTHMSNIDLLLNKLYTAGWQSARESYNQLQDQFRHEFLNGPVLYAFGTTVTDMLEKKSEIQAVVMPETWSKFEELGGRIKTIFDEVKPPSGDRIFNRAV